MTSVEATCRDCHRKRKPDAIFCECGAFLDYSVTTGEQQTDAEPDGRAADATAASDDEWPPGQHEPTSEPPAPPAGSTRFVHCRNETCEQLNPASGDLCWNCRWPIADGETSKPPWSLRRFLGLEKPPLRATERAHPPKPLLSKDDPIRTGFIVTAGLLLAGALLIGAIKAWGPASAGATHSYGVAREALFPRFNPVYPASVNPPRVEKRGKKWVKIPHPPGDAFDRNLSTYWQTRTPPGVPDKIRVTFNPAVHHIEEFVVFAGDPTGTTIVPTSLQMTFYRWDPNPPRESECEQRSRAVFPVWLRHGAHCVIGIEGPFELKNTPTPQRFSTGKHANVALVVVTIRGVHSNDNPKLKGAITEIEFFDRD